MVSLRSLHAACALPLIVCSIVFGVPGCKPGSPNAGDGQSFHGVGGQLDAQVSLVAAFSFNEGSGAAVGDSSGNGNVGTVQGAVWTTAGKYGGALSFNGSARVVVADSPSLRLSSAMTLSAWVKPSSQATWWQDVVYKGDDDYYLEGSSPSGGAPATGGTFAGGPLYGTGAPPVGAWTHLAVTYDRTTLRLYVNGAQVASRARTKAMVTSSHPLEIGGDGIYGQFFQGVIDEVRVYNRALSASEIQSDMNTPAP
jgi:hypothetical protein